MGSYSFPLNLFPILNIAVMPLWFGLLFFPRKAWVRISIDTFASITALLFVIVFIPGLKEALPVILDPKLPSVAALLSSPQGAYGAWSHFLIGDLWIGRWISAEGEAKGIPRLWLIPILVLTLLAGPVGLLAFLGLRFSLSRRRPS